MVDSSSVVLLVASVILHSCTATPQYFGGFGRPGFPGNGFSPTSANNINVNVVTGGIHSSGMSPFGGSLFPYLMKWVTLELQWLVLSTTLLICYTQKHINN
ncbi:hypothetical protein V3C99_016905 [Haemonchus contortus]